MHSKYSPCAKEPIWNGKLLSLQALLLVLLSSTAGLVSADAIEQGQKYVMATHSFNLVIAPRTNRRTGETRPGPLDILAEEAGKEGHEALAVQMIGGSTPMQHWNQGKGDDSKNIAKVALRKGNVDVFTISPNAIVPEEGIDLFGDLVIETNPKARILVQSSWNAWDGHGRTGAVGGSGGGSFVNTDRDKADMATLEGFDKELDEYLTLLRGQLNGIDNRAGRQITYVVPAADAVNNLRKQIISGNVPGITKQSEAFADPIGHGAESVVKLVTYTWYAAMYRETPVGLKSLINPDDPHSADRQLLLQKLAWNAVVNEPKSGVTGTPVNLN